MQITIKILTYLALPLIAVTFIPQKLNNSCRDYHSYWNIFFSSECYHNQDLYNDFSEVIEKYVGAHERHTVRTEDGYFLDLIRIPRENPRDVILLQHPMYFDARIWISQYNESVAFFFWRAGYDVWLGNTRGSAFGRRHAKLVPTDLEFWNFSFHEMGLYDNHAIVEYIKQEINQSKIIYLGFSMGATTGLVYASTRSKEIVDSIKLMVVIAPSAFSSHSTNILCRTLPIFFQFQQKFIDIRLPIFRHDIWYMRIVKSALTMFPCKKCILYFIGYVSGYTPDEFDPDLINAFIWTFGSELPLKVLHHLTQMFLFNGDFRMYDYGRERNLDVYGVEVPPRYPLENIKIPIFYMHGQNDSLCVPADNEKLYSLLPRTCTGFGKVMVEGFGHSDFPYGRHRNVKVYGEILQIVDRL